MNPQVPIVTSIPDSNRASNCNIFDSSSRPSDTAYRGLAWHDKIKNESKNLGSNNFFGMMSTKIIPKLKNLDAKIMCF